MYELMNNILAEIVGSILLKQARKLYGGWRTAAQKGQKSTTSLGIPRTQLFNRISEQQAIDSALVDASQLRILYFYGLGGASKTRLLEHAQTLINEISDSRPDLPLRWGGIIDLYHADLHSALALQNAILAGLQPGTEDFHAYQQERNRLEQRRTHGSPVTDQDLQQLTHLFIADYNQFARHCRPVIAFDTLENLVYETDFIQKICRVNNEPNAVQNWLVEQLPHFQNTVFLLASRPYDDLRKTLDERYRRSGNQFEAIALNGLTRDDFRNLLEELLRNAPPRLQVLTKSVTRLHRLTRGLPVALAVLVQLFTRLEDPTLAALEQIDDVAIWSKHLVESLFFANTPESRLFLLLALARKGLHPDLLAHLTVTQSLEECEAALANLRQWGVIKTRAGRNELFLHDALYELFDAYLASAEQLHPWYERIIAYYRGLPLHPREDRTKWIETVVHLLYYHLQIDPKQAFEVHYIRASEIAIKGRELGVDMRLRNELLRSLKSVPASQHPPQRRLLQTDVDLDSAVRWVKRLIRHERYDQAVQVSKMILSLSPSPYANLLSGSSFLLTELDIEQQTKAKELFAQASPLFWGQLLTCYGEALTYRGGDEVQIRQLFEQAIALLENVKTQTDAPSEWLRQRTVGSAYNSLGHLLWTHGHYQLALEHYTRALSHFRQAAVQDEEAATLNNLGYLLLLLGEVEEAQRYVKQGRDLREELGQKYPLVLSYNTLGLVYALQQQYDWAVYHCELALRNAVELHTPRGIGLAKIALGFIHRRQGKAERLRVSITTQVSIFQTAQRYLLDAVAIFSAQVKEPKRLLEALNELGSLSEDWALWLQDQREFGESQTKYAEAFRYQQQALTIARENSYHFQEADICDDLAQLLATQGKFLEARQWVEQIFQIVPQNFRLAPGAGFQQAPPPGEAYWFVLGKAYRQLAVWTNRDLQGLDRSGQVYVQTRATFVEQLTFSAAYFMRYWAEGLLLQEQLQHLTLLSRNSNTSVEFLYTETRLFASRYMIDLEKILQMLSS